MRRGVVRDYWSVVETVLDYLLIPTDPGLPATDEHPAGAEGPVDLGNGTWIERPDAQLAERLMLACEFRGEQWTPARQFGVAQALVREVDSTDPRQRHLYAWDEDQRLYTTLALSRLIRPHGTACDYAVRRIVDTAGAERLIPHDAGEARVAFRIDTGSRGWLDTAEAQQLGALLAAYDPDRLPRRVSRALWLCELMVRERYLEDTLPLIVAALEALLKVGRERLTAQFAQRTAALAGELGILIEEEQAVAAYDDRSGIVHGAQIDLSQPTEYDRFVATVDALQQALRAATRKAIEDPGFGAVFAADDDIAARWPLRPRAAG
jgi:hypothetical protein